MVSEVGYDVFHREAVALPPHSVYLLQVFLSGFSVQTIQGSILALFCFDQNKTYY